MPEHVFQKLFGQLSGQSQSVSPDQVERAELAFYISYLRYGMTVFDAGANIGFMTLLFSNLVGKEGHVHSFEANSQVFARLELICHTTGYANIIPNHLALADKVGSANLYLYGDQHLSWSSLAKRPLEQYGIDARVESTEPVATTTIDDYCEKNSIAVIDLLKIDVEGAEYQVLLGARRMLQEKRIRCCVFEFGQTTFDMGNNPNLIESYLQQNGYRIKNLVQGDPVFPGRTDARTAKFSMHVVMPK